MRHSLLVLVVLALALLVGAAVPVASAYPTGSCSVTQSPTTWLPPGIAVRPVNFSWSVPAPAPTQDIVVEAVIVDDTGLVHKYSAFNVPVGSASPAYYGQKDHIAWASVWVTTCAKGTGYCGLGEQVAACHAVIAKP